MQMFVYVEVSLIDFIYALSPLAVDAPDWLMKA